MATLSVKGLSPDLMYGQAITPDHFQLMFSGIHNPYSITFTSSKVTVVEYSGHYSNPATNPGAVTSGSTYVWDIGGTFTRAADGTINGTATSIALGDLGSSGTGTKVALMSLTGINTTYASILDMVHWQISPATLMAGNDTLNASGFVANPLFPGLGVDLAGEAGNDIIVGSIYNDQLLGGKGNDHMTGGKGNDTYRVDSTLDVVVELANEGVDQVKSTVSYTLGTNVEDLNLNTYLNVNGTGNALNNFIKAGAGNNVLSGLGGNDTLLGNTGKDTLRGGTGNDTFKFATTGDSAIGVNRDVITDFVRGQDKIHLAAIDANTATAGTNDAFTTVIASNATFSAAGQLKLSNGILYGNTDADATAEFEIALTGITTLATSDFVL